MTDVKELEVGKSYKYLGHITGPMIASLLPIDILKQEEAGKIPEEKFNVLLQEICQKSMSEVFLLKDQDILRIFERI